MARMGAADGLGEGLVCAGHEPGMSRT